MDYEANMQQGRTELAALTVDKVMSVYSGKPGCACGCKGKHSYNSACVDAASLNRGYTVTPDEVNDRQVARVLGLVQANPALLETWEPGDSHFAVTLASDSGSQRLYIVYIAEAANV